MADEFNKFIYAGEPVSDNPELEAAEREEQILRQAELPKFKLEEGEKLYISREKIAELNTEYFEMLDNMREGFAIANAESRSYMESVFFASYKSTIEELQKSGKEKASAAELVHKYKQLYLKPEYERKHWYSRKEKPNYSMRLILREAELQTQMELSARQVEIERQQAFINGGVEEPDIIDDFITLLSEEFARPRKQGQFIEKNSKFIIWVLTEFLIKNSVDKAVKLFIERFIPERKQEKFNTLNGEYLKGIITEFMRRQKVLLDNENTEDNKEPEEVSPSEGIESIAEAPEDEQNAENGAVDGDNVEAEEESGTEELGDLNELQALEVELAEEHAGEEIAGEPKNAEQLKIVVPEPPKTEPQKFALMLIPQAMPWDIIRNKAAAEPKAVKEVQKDEPIKNIDEGG